jgi:hypothetical protein
LVFFFFSLSFWVGCKFLRFHVPVQLGPCGMHADLA